MKKIVQLTEYDFDNALYYLKAALNNIQSMGRKSEKIKNVEEYLKMGIERLTDKDQLDRTVSTLKAIV